MLIDGFVVWEETPTSTDLPTHSFVSIGLYWIVERLRDWGRQEGGEEKKPQRVRRGAGCFLAAGMAMSEE